MAHEQIFAYTRTLGDATALVLLNFAETEVSFALDPALEDLEGFRLLLGNYEDDEALNDGLVVITGETGESICEWAMRGYEGRVYLRVCDDRSTCSLQ